MSRPSLSDRIETLAANYQLLGLLGVAYWTWEGIRAIQDGSRLAALWFSLALAGLLFVLLEVALIRAQAELLRVVRRIANQVAPVRREVSPLMVS